jgi:hypothetical protein
MELPSYHPCGILNFEETSRFLENLCTTVLVAVLVSVLVGQF